MNEFNESEFIKICSRLNAEPHSEEITIEYQNGSFFYKMKTSVENDRRGEVAFCVIRPNGRIITVTCEEYPRGIYRIPTGGIGHDEDIIEAVYREVREELGIDVEIMRFAGVLKIKFKHKNDSFMFYSYVFLLRETGGKLLVDAKDNEISEVKEVDIEGLEKVVNGLINIQGPWHDWGKFRFHSSNAVLKYLRKEGLEVC